MRKATIVLILAVIILAAALFAKFTGLVVTSINTCADTDGQDSSSKGEINGFYYLFTKENYTLEDYCADETTLIEYYCIQDGMHSYKESMEYKCELGCLEGACKTGGLVPIEERPAPQAKSIFERFINGIRAAFGI